MVRGVLRLGVRVGAGVAGEGFFLGVVEVVEVFGGGGGE